MRIAISVILIAISKNRRLHAISAVGKIQISLLTSEVANASHAYHFLPVKMTPFF